MKEFFLILGMVIVTFGVRYPVLALLGKIDLPKQVLRALKFVPTAVLTAIIVPAVMIYENKIYLAIDNAYLAGSIIAVLVSWFTKSLVWTILAGMAAFYIWRLLW